MSESSNSAATLIFNGAGNVFDENCENDPSTMPAVRSLPSADSIAAQRDALKSKVDGRVGLAFFLLST